MFGYRRKLLWESLFLPLSFLLLIFARTLTAFVIDFVILTIGEMTSFAGLPAWIAQLTNVDEAGHYQGLLNIMMSVDGRLVHCTVDLSLKRKLSIFVYFSLLSNDRYFDYYLSLFMAFTPSSAIA